MESKHTPGPWYADEDGRIREEATDYIIARTDDGGHISGRRMISETAEADNARLIAAAPAMRRALDFIADRIRDHGKLAASPETLKEWAAVISHAADLRADR